MIRSSCAGGSGVSVWRWHHQPIARSCRFILQASVLAEHGSELAVYPAFYGIVRAWETSDDFSVTVYVRFQEREHFPAFR